MAKTGNWGGPWTEEKLKAFEKYVEAYLTIMYSTREKLNGWPKEIIYFDGFAGSGSRMENDNNQVQMQSILLDFNIQKEEAEVYQGSGERVLSLTKKFDKYYFVDLDTSALGNLKQKLSEKNLVTENCIFRTGDVNEVVSDFINQWNENKVALVLLDPYGMQVKWSTIEKMIDKRIDLWYHLGLSSIG
jgi:three-Cys-motif partner protein